MVKESKTHYVLVELGYHLPYSIFGITLGLIAMGVLSFLAILMRAEGLLPEASIELFHVFHPAHVLVSAVATTAMFYKHEKRVLKAIVVGFFGSIVICGLSDIFFPFAGGVVLGVDMHMHVCILENPGLIVPFALVGVAAGLLVTKSFEHSTQYSHSAHVFVSSVASILYLLGFGLTDWIHVIGGVFLITIIAVMVPCCASDIIFPLACVHRDCRHSSELKHEH
ncbi:MAG: hypothetical protein KAR32_03315 [Candidatus Omnitrophica bacterium]|nr:hypothetical protein [Candidatus Omnitrophota bacterium]